MFFRHLQLSMINYLCLISRVNSQNYNYHHHLTFISGGLSEFMCGRVTATGDRLLDSSFDWSPSRPNSSLGNTSLMTADTSLGNSFSSLYSMSSIYTITDDSQLKLLPDFPLGEGNFGFVCKAMLMTKGLLSKSGDDFEIVAVKMIKGDKSFKFTNFSLTQ